MIENLTLVCQILILAGMVWIVWNLVRINKLTRRSTDLIEHYRREVQWLTSRLEVLERPRGDK